ncbi:hypothetical protein FOA52_006907 [Chlamydomonas sp. UWO 241]|nr:hypothetical protein FOA52_006907 [Chlamydomonas sp. UWO 241]
MVRSTRTVDHACLVAYASAAPARAPHVLGQLRAALACVAVVLAALPTAWVEAAAGGAALTVLRPLRQFSPLPQEGERAAVVEILRLVGWQLPGIITPAGWRRGRPGLRSTAARPAPQPAAAGGGAAGEPRWVGFAHGPGVVGKLTCKLAVALQLRAVVDERRVRRAATVEAALALDHGPHGGPRASDVQVCAGLRGLEAAVPLLNARKEPIWRLWMARDGIVRGALRDASYLGSTRHVRRLFSDCYGPEETAVAAAAVRVAAAAVDGVSLPVCLAMNLVRFVHDVSGRDRPAGGGVVSASFLNAKPAVGGIGVEPRRGGVLRVLFTVASDAVADTVVRSRRNLRDVDPSAAVFDVLSDRKEAQHRALWPAFLAAKAAGKRAQFHRARLVVDGERVPAPAC